MNGVKWARYSHKAAVKANLRRERLVFPETEWNAMKFLANHTPFLKITSTSRIRDTWVEAHDMPASADHDGQLDVDDDIVDQFDRWQGMLDRTETSYM